MAVTSIRSVRRPIRDTVAYVLDPEKTGKEAVGKEMYRKYWAWGINVRLETAGEDMLRVKEYWKKEDGARSYHVYQSFAEGEITPYLAQRIGVLLARELWGERFQVVVATHMDKKSHIHNHLLMNSVSFVDGKKFNSQERSYFRLRAVSDKLCRRYGLSVPSRGVNRKKMRRQEEAVQKGKPNLLTTMAWDVDRAIMASVTEGEFLENLNKMGYGISFRNRKGKDTEDLRLRIPGSRWFVPVKNLGEEYGKEQLQKRILDNIIGRNSFLPSGEEGEPAMQGEPEKVPTVFSLSGLYRRYAQELNQISRFPGSVKRVSLFLRQDLIRRETIDKQVCFLEKHGIEKGEQLPLLLEELGSDLKQMKVRYVRLTAKIQRERRMERPDRVRTALIDRAKLLEKIQERREECRLCTDILNRQKQTGKELEILAREREKGEGYESVGRAGRTGREDFSEWD